MKKLLSLVVLISGNGSNLQAIIDAIVQKRLHATINIVIADKADAYGLQRASLSHIPSKYLDSKNYQNRQEYDAALQNIIDSYQPDLVILAGFMRILSKSFVKHYLGRMLNIHPSLLPKYPGLHTYSQALKAGDQLHGTTIHFVTEEVDCGPIIAQSSLTILPNETIDSLAQRVQLLEHQLYPLVLQWIAENRIRLEGQQVMFDDEILPKYGKQVTFTITS